MKPIKNDVYWVGVNDWEVRHFHGYELSTHRGTSYNAYLIKGEKNVLIDTVWEPLTHLFMDKLTELIDIKNLDYIVCNHAEPDHSGALPHIMKIIPDVPIICSKKGVETITRHYHKDWNFHVVKTGDKISIGDKELLFVEAPYLHWPDSMFTYLTKENILFPNDAFGQHYSSSELFNDEVDEEEVFQEAIKYYANILTPFSKLVIKKIEELVSFNLPIDMIAPSHGIIWRKEPLRIVEKYMEWAKGKQENRAVIIYNSMWGATRLMAEYIGKGLDDKNIPYKLFNVATADKNDILTEIFKSRGLICGSSTINNGILPSLAPVLDDLKGLNYQNKIGCAFGSYGWSPMGPKVLETYMKNAHVDIVQEPIKIKYMPDENDLEKCMEFGQAFGEKLC